MISGSPALRPRWRGAHLAASVETGVEHPRRQRLTKLQWDRGAAGGHDHARDALRMNRRLEKGSRRCDRVELGGPGAAGRVCATGMTDLPA